MTLEERVAALEKELEGLRRGKNLSAAEAHLREKALAYARVKTMGFYLDRSGNRILVSPSDTGSVEVARENMEFAAEALLRELSLEGGQ